MGKYKYFQGGREVDRAAFVKFVSEECMCVAMPLFGGYSICAPDYKAGERETKRLQRQAYAHWKACADRGSDCNEGMAIELFGGVPGGNLHVQYWR